MDFITIIITIGIVQGILIGILLLTINRGNIRANRLLGFLMLIFSVSISGFLSARLLENKELLFLVELPSSVVLLIGPMFYLYVLALVKKEYKFKKSLIIHFLPFLLLLVFNFIFFLISSKSELIEEYGNMFSPLDRIMIGFQVIHVFTYLFFVRKILAGHELNIKSTLSYTDNVNLKWLRLTVVVLQFIFGIIALSVVLISAGVQIEKFLITFLPVLVSFVILGLGYRGFSQPVIFPVEEEITRNRKYEWSTLTEEKADICLEKLLAKMGSDKPYLDNGLTLQKLADLVGFSPQNLSQVINEKTNQNFFDFINSYRIKEAKHLLIEPYGELMTILAIAEEVGFNSKSSFNTAFKKITGMTPTEYKKSVTLGDF